MHQIVDFAAELGVKLYPGQAEALDEYYSSGKPNWLLLAGRRSGKSLLSDLIVCYEATVPDFAGMLRSGEQRFIIVVSVRQDNAGLHITNIGKLLRHNRGLARLITLQTKDRIELSNGVTILSLPASARAGRGYTASTLILDELAHFVDSDGNSSADAVYDAFSPTLATFGDRGRLVITTTPAARTGIVFELFDRASSGELDDYHITRKPTREMNPRVTEKVIARAFKRDARAAATEYEAEFADPVAAFFEPGSIEQAIDKRLKRAERGKGEFSYAMAIDPATMTDRYAFVICHKDGDAIVLDHAQLLYPPVDHNEAEALIVDLAGRFNPATIRCDTAATAIRLKSQLPMMEYIPFTRPTKLRIYGTLKEALNLGNVILYPDADLIAELKALQIRNGVDIAAPRSGTVKHDDLADCLALCADALTSGTGITYTLPNIFYGDYEGLGFDEFLIVGGSWQHLPFANKKTHPPGISYENCPKRNKGCESCIAELEAIGYYEQQEKAARVEIPMSEEDARREILAVRGISEHTIIEGMEEKRNERKTLQRFWKNVSKR